MPEQLRNFQIGIVLGLLGMVILAAIYLPAYFDQNSSTLFAQASTGDWTQIATPSKRVSKSTAINSPPIVRSPAPIQTASGLVRTETNCTYDSGTWYAYPAAWPVAGFAFGGLSIDRERALTILASDPANVREDLLKQMITYSLNVFRGADPSIVVDTVKRIGDWLYAHPDGEELTDPDEQIAANLGMTLQLFNQGLIGPGLCSAPIEIPPGTATPTQTAMPLPSATTTPSITPSIATVILNSPANPAPKPKATKIKASPTIPPPTPFPTQPPTTTPFPTQPPTPTPVPTEAATPTSPPPAGSNE